MLTTTTVMVLAMQLKALAILIKMVSLI